MGNYSAIIVDDSPDARMVLKMILRSFPEILLTGEAENIQSAEDVIRQQKPDIVFLDIEMPGGNGFELVERLHVSGIQTNIIFVTAHQNYIIEAIRASAFDYIMKPIDPEEIRKSLRRLRFKQRRQGLGKIYQLLEMYHHPSRIKINTKSGFLLIDTHDITYLQADGTYTDIFLNNGNLVASSVNLGKLVEKLPDYDFMRISRSCCVNLNYMKMVNRIKSLCILEVDGQTIELSISRQYMRRIDEAF